MTTCKKCGGEVRVTPYTYESDGETLSATRYEHTNPAAGHPPVHDGNVDIFVSPGEYQEDE